MTNGGLNSQWKKLCFVMLATGLSDIRVVEQYGLLALINEEELEEVE